LFPAEQEVSNTILRKYRKHSERFLRVSFTDEDDKIKVCEDFGSFAIRYGS
jgi:hypothetical protein